MKYVATLAITLPAFAHADIEADSDEAAIEKAKALAAEDHEDSDLHYQPSFEWTEENRIVELIRSGEDGVDVYVAGDIVVCQSYYLRRIAELEKERDMLLDAIRELSDTQAA